MAWWPLFHNVVCPTNHKHVATGGAVRHCRCNHSDSRSPLTWLNTPCVFVGNFDAHSLVSFLAAMTISLDETCVGSNKQSKQLAKTSALSWKCLHRSGWWHGWLWSLSYLWRMKILEMTMHSKEKCCYFSCCIYILLPAHLTIIQFDERITTTLRRSRQSYWSPIKWY